MPPTRRVRRAELLLKSYIRNHKGRQRRAFLRRRAAARVRDRNPEPPTPRRQFEDDLPLDDSDTSSDSDSSSDTSSHSSTSGSTTDSQWSDILGPDWRFMNDMLVHQENLDS
ncbi:hypothetical protein B0H16DRAFT_1469498 [Mycena metata]|uniref:Uncharacterized protein n=1 Tax=Mycena metata TaxID=1033252 RepID=A0AAD7MRZ2_9AGAR|nr:hypothetical protein B0H16DRAFT_1469498 [Mycena metata]